MKKVFLNFDEQVDLLISRGLNVDDKSKLVWYLKKFNYENFINGYNDIFLVEKKRKLNKYRSEVNSSMLISLFNFDRRIASYILGEILSIERMLATTISYEITKKYKDIFPSLNNGEILNLNAKELLTLFPGIKRFVKASDVGRGYARISDELAVRELIKLLKNNCHSKLNTNNYQDDLLDCPIWKLSVHWSFGQANNIFWMMEEDLQKKVAISILGNNYPEEVYLSLSKVFKCLTEVRNIICHNNVLFNYQATKFKCEIKNFFKIIFKQNITKIKLFEIIQIIGKLTPHKSSFKIDELCEKQLNTLSSNFDEKSFNLLLEEINFVKKTQIY
ncbi:MAG: Abi family protein [Mycoplasma sp.]